MNQEKNKKKESSVKSCPVCSHPLDKIEDGNYWCWGEQRYFNKEEIKEGK